MRQGLIFVLVLLALGLAVAVLSLWLRLRSATRREALQALAARRGWALNITEGKLGRPAVTRLSPRGGPGWQVTARFEAAPAPALRPKSESTEFVAEEPHWPEALLVIAPPLPLPAGHEPAQDLPTSLDSAEGRARLTALLGPDMESHAAVLRPWPGPAGLTILASADPRLRADFNDVAKLYAAFAPQPGVEGFPVMMLGADGFRLRLRHDIKRADRMEAFVDLAQDLSRIL